MGRKKRRALPGKEGLSKLQGAIHERHRSGARYAAKSSFPCVQANSDIGFGWRVQLRQSDREGIEQDSSSIHLAGSLIRVPGLYLRTPLLLKRHLSAQEQHVDIDAEAHVVS